MKTRFNTLDVTAAVNDLKFLEGMRIVNVYDINHKTYIMKLSHGSEKFLILFESGIRIHRAYHDCQKAPFPSNFSVKLRKHLNNRRLCKVTQLGMDRIVDMQIDEGDRCVHVIVELYDRGNIVLTDSYYVILNILRPRSDKDADVRLFVKERYPVPPPRTFPHLPSIDEMTMILRVADQKAPLKRAVAQPGLYSSSLLEHVLIREGLNPDLQVCAIKLRSGCASRVTNALNDAARITQEIQEGRSLGFIPYLLEQRTDGTDVETFLEYHPYLFAQHEKGKYFTYGTFSEAVDAFYAVQDAQKQQQGAFRLEKEAMKKLENVRRDQYRRLLELEQTREEKMIQADLIIFNQALVDSAINIICNALAQKATWDDVERMRLEAIRSGDAVARTIVRLDLPNNKIIMRLSEELEGISPRYVPIDISMTAFNNSCELYGGMKAAAEKILRTEAAAEKAIKNAEEKASTTIKQVHVRADTAKVRKEMWFEKFIWFISSDNYLVITGRDAQQNELLVKRYLRPGDIYVHAEAHGAASVIIRNKYGGGEIPPKTMLEAGHMAVCCSGSWGSRIISSAWWVYDDQVSKIAPTGEYLSHGSFMIRGRKNYLPTSPLVLGFGILFRMDQFSVLNHVEPLSSERTDSDMTGDSVELKEEEDDVEKKLANPTADPNEIDDDEEYPDIKLDVPTVRLRYHVDTPEDYSVIDFSTKFRPRKKEVDKEKETQQYLDKKAEEERKTNASKKGGKRQKHKMEKIRRKYRDQDEEEREMRLTLLGSRGKQATNDDKASVDGNQKKVGPPKQEAKKVSKKNGPGDSVEKKNYKTRMGKVVDIGVDGKKIEKEVIVNIDETSGEGPFFEVEKHLDTTICENFLKGEGIGVSFASDYAEQMEKLRIEEHPVMNPYAQMEEDEEEKKEFAAAEETDELLDQLTYEPLPEDVLLYALPMVGPYQTFNNFIYKCKLTPGTTRKGKACKAALDLFLRMKNVDAREQALIRALVGDESAWRNIPSGCRVSAPQLHANK